ncbi:hypothetical protein CO608_04450 [Lysobacteraceae bacterium NML08-0793]|nr:hypothetical protein CO608_04450 [Xanthomonadaceae bacterium NML08-0793]
MSTPFVHHPTPLTPSRTSILISLAATATGIALLLWLDASLPFILALCAAWGVFDLVDFRTRKTSTPSRVEVDGERISITRYRFFSRLPYTEHYPLSDCLAVATSYELNFRRLHTQLFLKKSYQAPITLDFHPHDMSKGKFFSKHLCQDTAEAAAFRQAMADAAGLRDAGFFARGGTIDVIKSVYGI